MTNWTGTQKRAQSWGLSRPWLEASSLARGKRHSMSIVGNYWQQPTGAAHTAPLSTVAIKHGAVGALRVVFIILNAAIHYWCCHPGKLAGWWAEDWYLMLSHVWAPPPPPLTAVRHLPSDGLLTRFLWLVNLFLLQIYEIRRLLTRLW